MKEEQMPIDEQLLAAEGLTTAEIEKVKHYVEAAGEIDSTATVIYLNDRLLFVCRTAALALQVVRPEVMNLPDTDEAWIMSHNRELKDELLAMAERGEPCPSPDTLLGRALRMFTTEEDDLD